jgi:hypothetical protein
MASVTRIHPTATTNNTSIAPTQSVQFFTIDYINAINGSAGPEGAQAAVIAKINTLCTIIQAGPLGNSNTEQTFAIDRDSLVNGGIATLQALLRTLGTIDGVNLSSLTVTEKDMYIAV